MTTDYVPIDCGLHSQYELAIMRRQRLVLSWAGESRSVDCCTVTPLDLFTRQAEEFLRLRDEEGIEHTVRLDRITSCLFPAEA